MTKITRAEVFAIAQMSAIALPEDEVDLMITQIEQVLSYAERVAQIVVEGDGLPIKSVNVFRKDIVVVQDPERILVQAPVREGNYFVVPMILDN